jgi:hypothetical protein
MGSVIELKGKDIINAYDGNKLSPNFGYSCANFNISYYGKKFRGFSSSEDMQGNDLKMFDLFTENTNNISCFVYINDNNQIEARRMFFKGKQLLDHNIFPIKTKLGEEIYYLYGYYGNYVRKYDSLIIQKMLETYHPKIVHMDNGTMYNGTMERDREYWLMEIEKMNYDKYPPVDFLYLSTQLKAFSNFEPNEHVIQWLNTFYKKDDITFGLAYRYTTETIDFKHWNQKYYNLDDEDDIEDWDDNVWNDI